MVTSTKKEPNWTYLCRVTVGTAKHADDDDSSFAHVESDTSPLAIVVKVATKTNVAATTAYLRDGMSNKILSE
jgi:hypothetical protein